jgi:acetyl esterase/lipase
MYAKPLVAAGYTVFTINHRSAPRFRYPAAVEDVQRAVRFVRHHAQQFGIRADRIGAAGGSSGGHLVSLLGALDGKGDPADPDPVNRESAKVQCVIARAAPVDFFTMAGAGVPLAVNFLGMTGGVGTAAEPLTSIEKKTSREASPMYYVSADDPPFLLIHGDADATVPFSQSEKMEKVLKDAGVPARLLRISGGGHGPTFTGATNPPDYLGEMVRWFDRYLKDGTAAR